MTGTALALAAMLATATPAPPGATERAAHPEIASPRPVPIEMIPDPGHWEADDAPAYFSAREHRETARDIGRGAATGGLEAADLRTGFAAARSPERGSSDVVLARDIASPVPLPRPGVLAAPAARPRP